MRLEAAVRVAAALWIGMSLLGSARVAGAHPLAPALLEVRELGDGRAEVTWKTSALRVRGASEEPVVPADCQQTSPPTISEQGTSVVRRWTIECPGGVVGRTFAVEGLGVGKKDALLRIALADGRVVQHVLRADKPEFAVPDSDRPSSVLAGYARLGVEHILTGLDHLLFVFGLLLLATGPRLLIETVTAFTVGHSITLSLAALGLANVPSGPVEVLIALSIFALAVELSRGKSASPTLLRRFPWLMAFLFGLLHGLGFAGALREIGLPPDDVPLALFSFNLGIEIGQLLFVLVILAAGFALRRVLVRLPAWSERIPVYGIGCLSAYWVIERVVELWP